jgi:hypothetical protein
LNKPPSKLQPLDPAAEVMRVIDDFPALPRKRRLLIALIAVATAITVVLLMLYPPGGVKRKPPPPPPDAAACAPGQTSGCVGGIATVIVPALPATAVSTPGR